MRQFQIHYKRVGTAYYTVLEPVVNSGLYMKPEILAAIDHMRQTPCVVGIAVCLGDEMFNIVSFTQDAQAPKTFTFDTEIV